MIRIYGKQRWHNLRRKVLKERGWKCEQCGRYGMLEVDHIVPIRKGGEKWDRKNLQVLCKRCHSLKTNRADFPKRKRTAWDNLIDDLQRKNL